MTTDLPAGRELDALIGERVMGLTDVKLHTHVQGEDLFGQRDGLTEWVPSYSTSIEAAWQVLDEMVWHVGTANIRLDMEDYGRGASTQEEGAERAVWVTIGEHTAFGPAPWAICQAALGALQSVLTPPEHPHTDPPAPPDCDCGAGWVNGYRDGQHVLDRSGEHSRYCSRHGDPECVRSLGRAHPVRGL